MDLQSQLATKLREPVKANPPRAPVGLDTKLNESTCQETRNIWLDAGFHAWVAWFRSDATTKAALARLQEDLRRIAQYLCRVEPDDTVQSLVEHLFATW